MPTLAALWLRSRLAVSYAPQRTATCGSLATSAMTRNEVERLVVALARLG
jgi:hypothetical protein